MKIPEGISDQTAAAAMLKGLTVQYLIRSDVQGAGGRDRAVPRGGRRRRPDRLPVAEGARRHVIGTVGSDEKAKVAKAHGYEHSIVYTKEEFARA